jgi:small-conductance mechanosensitive channel
MQLYFPQYFVGVRRLFWLAVLFAGAVLIATSIASAQGDGRPSPSGTPGGAAVATQPQAPASRMEQGAPVVLHGRILFQLREGIGAYSAQQRASDISERLSRLAESPDEQLPSLRLEERNGITVILAGDAEIMAVTDADARAAGEERAAYAQRLLAILAEPLSADKREFSWRSLLQGAVFAALATAVLYLFFVFTRRALRGIVWWIYEQKDKRIRAIRFQKTELLSARRITRLLVLFARLAWIVLLLFALYVYLPIVFRFFPYTRQISDQIISYTLTPVRVLWGMFLAEIPNLFFLLVISVIAYYLVRLARFLFQEIAEERIAFTGFYPDWAIPTFKIVRVLIITFAIIIAYPYIPGSESDAFKGVSLFFGLLFSLGSTGIVSNIVSGVILTYTRAFIIGDRVKIGETTGDVIEKTLLVTRLRTIKNVDVSIPNSILLSSQIVNYSTVSKEKGLILHTTVTIGYDVPWRQVHELLIQAALATPDLLDNPRPFVLQTSLDDFYVSYELNAYTNAAMRMAATYSKLHANIQDRFNEAGVEIMSPHYRAARDGNQTTIPAEYLPDDYTTPSFRVSLTAGPGKSAEGVTPSPSPSDASTLSSEAAEDRPH